jgi:hypothetical protein
VRGRLALLVSAVALPGLLLATIFIFQAYRHERASVGERLLHTARAVASVVDGEVDNAHTMLRALAATSVIARHDLVELDRVARRALADDERWFALTDARGQQEVNTRVPRGTALPRITDFDAEFHRAMREGREYVSNLRPGPVAGALVVHVSRPFDYNGELYALHLAMLPEMLARSLRPDRFAPTGIVTVLDRNGRIILRNRGAEKYVGQSATPDIVRATALQAEGMVDSVTLEKIPVLAVFSRARCGWSVAIGAPKAELYATAERLLWWGIGCSVLLGAVAVLMAAWIARALIRSVDALRADAETIRRGQMPARSSSGLQETDFVAEAMRRTATALLQRTRTLETISRVNARLVAERDVQMILADVIDAGREVSGAAYGVLWRARAAMPRPRCRQGPAPPRRCATRWAWRQTRPCLTRQARAKTSCTSPICRPTRVPGASRAAPSRRPASRGCAAIWWFQ